MNFSKEDIQQLLDLAKDRRVYLEGNIIKIIIVNNHINRPKNFNLNLRKSNRVSFKIAILRYSSFVIQLEPQLV